MKTNLDHLFLISCSNCCFFFLLMFSLLFNNKGIFDNLYGFLIVNIIFSLINICRVELKVTLTCNKERMSRRQRRRHNNSVTPQVHRWNRVAISLD
nr:hypothetical protein Itr_chr08CG17230 [Ipomoea trifida]